MLQTGEARHAGFCCLGNKILIVVFLAVQSVVPGLDIWPEKPALPLGSEKNGKNAKIAKIVEQSVIGGRWLDEQESSVYPPFRSCKQDLEWIQRGE